MRSIENVGFVWTRQLARASGRRFTLPGGCPWAAGHTQRQHKGHGQREHNFQEGVRTLTAAFENSADLPQGAEHRAALLATVGAFAGHVIDRDEVSCLSVAR